MDTVTVDTTAVRRPRCAIRVAVAEPARVGALQAQSHRLRVAAAVPLHAGVSTVAELVSNDRPLSSATRANGSFRCSRTIGDALRRRFQTPTEWHDPLIRGKLREDGNFALFTFNEYAADSLNYAVRAPDPAGPDPAHLLGTDAAGRDVAARLLYGFRISVYFGLALTLVGTVLGIIIGAIQATSAVASTSARSA